MKNSGWPSFSFTELLRPSDGWKTEHAILSTYSADLVVIVTALLALTGCDLEHRRTGSRVELVKAVEALRGRVCVLAQSGRVTIPHTPRPILKLLDIFLRTVEAPENVRSWHPKVAIVRYHRVDDPTDRLWRVWLGSRNLTKATNWEAGLSLMSRSDGRGQQIEGLANLGASLASRANLKTLSGAEVAAELAALTWECPAGTEVKRVQLLGPESAGGFPKPPSDVERVFVVSPFLDAKTVRTVAEWGNRNTRRTLVSTAMELERLLRENEWVFEDFSHLLIQPLPDLPAEGAELLDEAVSAPVESSESEEVPPAGLHAKLYFAAKGARRQLWLGSANATSRGWESRNFEVVAELSISRDVADAIEGFVASCERFTHTARSPASDEDEDALEQARKLVSGHWTLRQRVGESALEVLAPTPPPIDDPTILLDVAVLGGTWVNWPHEATSILLTGIRRWERANFLQVRLSRGEKMCSWLHFATCDPPPDEERDRALIAQYLDPRTFLEWVRSMLNNEPARPAGGDWDIETTGQTRSDFSERVIPEFTLMPTVEEILRAWARDSTAFAAADEKVRAYLNELERRAKEGGMDADLELLQKFEQTWSTLSTELL